MAQQLSLLNLKLLVPNTDYGQLRRDLKRGEKLFLLSKEEQKRMGKINFDGEYEAFKKEREFSAELSGLPEGEIVGLGVNGAILTITVKK